MSEPNETDIWHPTMHLKFVMNMETSRVKVLHQLWHNDTGEQEWRAVPVEYVFGEN